MPHDVFISYASQDKAAADAVCAVLEREGIRCWIAPRDVLPGKDWSESIIDAINASRAIVLVYSRNANESAAVKREVERAVNRGLAVVPLRIQDVPPSKALEFFISTSHWMDALTPPLEAHLMRLAGVLKHLLHGEEAPAPVAPKRSARGQKVGLAVIGLLVILAVCAMWIARGQAAKPQSAEDEITVAMDEPLDPGETAFSGTVTGMSKTKAGTLVITVEGGGRKIFGVIDKPFLNVVGAALGGDVVAALRGKTIELRGRTRPVKDRPKVRAIVIERAEQIQVMK